MMELGWVEFAQFEFGFVSASLSELRPLVEGLLRVGEADVSNFPQANPAPVGPRLVHSGSQQD